MFPSMTIAAAARRLRSRQPACKDHAMDTDVSFPRLSARTRRFTLGAPRGFALSPRGDRLLFLRSPSGDDPTTGLWTVDVEDGALGAERLIADPAALLADAGPEDLPPEERARRERTREQAAGITAFGADRDGATVVFALSGRAWRVDVESGAAEELHARGPVIDPRPDPTGRRVAYVNAGALRVLDADGDRTLAEPAGPDVTWGLADFIAAEEMDRYRGFWWSPDGEAIAVARVDDSAVRLLHIADPAHPERPAAPHRYPAAGAANPDVSLHIVHLGGPRIVVDWDRSAFEYLARVSWTGDGLLITVQSRDQRTVRYLTVDPATGATTPIAEDRDDAWVELIAGSPAWMSGQLVRAADRDGWRRLLIGERVITPAGLQLHGISDCAEDGVLFTASAEPTESHLWLANPDGSLRQLTTAAGVHTGTRAGSTTVIAAASLDHFGNQVRVWRDGAEVGEIASRAATPPLTLNVRLSASGPTRLRTAVLFPTGHVPGSGRLPVLLDPYGGPHAQRVQRARSRFLTSQWFADQGFAVVVADGRGTPGRGAAWERAVRGDLAGPVLEDQVSALEAVLAEHADLDASRVGIRGWSFGGYLAALAVLRRPDVFHAAVAGAPVAEWRLYDTHYTERYLGRPDVDPAAYDRSSLLPDADKLERPLLLIHGLADDNVLVANTLALSGALLAAGRRHQVLPLTGVTHMTPQEVVAENLLRFEVSFFAEALGGLARR
jgi:dipeptidyl-peptidase-4